MLTNLFSMFDYNFYFINPFLLQFIFILFFFQSKISFHKNFNKFNINNKMIINFLNKEFKNDIKYFFLKKKVFNMGTMKMFYSIFIILFMLNISSLFPMVFSSTSHISMNLPISMILWMSIIILSLMMSWKNFFSHLTPKGTPIALMSFMVLIESVSMIIRPITLSVRLMANMVAGHLLLYLLSNFSLISNMKYMMSLPAMFVLSILELGVSLIQSYVFTLLLVLYFKENF